MQPVLWTKGVLLSPQHLQTQDRFLEDLIGFQLSSLTFCPWGFDRLDIDHEALAGGAVALSAASGMLPDGLLFDIPHADPAPPPKQLEGCWEPDQKALDVYLAIPEYRQGGLNVGAKQGDGTTRYLAEVVMRRDENTGLAEKPIQVARKNFRLLVEGESLEGNSALPLARINRAPTGEYQLDPQFVPPLINITASDYMLAVARRLLEILTSKSSALADTRRQRNLSLAEFGISDVASFWLLYTVNTHMPQLRHLFETRRGQREPLRLFQRSGREAARVTGHRGTGKLRVASDEPGKTVGLRHRSRPGPLLCGPAVVSRAEGERGAGRPDQAGARAHQSQFGGQYRPAHHTGLARR
jgi:type VI secretion system protein ImpJ